MKTGSELIAFERHRQQTVEGWTPQHDQTHTKGELIAAALSYIRAAINIGHPGIQNPPQEWPWDDECWKPSPDRCRNLAKAGALIAAEIDRMQRFSALLENSTRVPDYQPPPPAYGIIDPDYARIFTVARKLAWEEGYALAMHGTFTRDLDLVAIPWTDQARDPEHLVRRILASHLRLQEAPGNPGSKPHGRKAWTLLLPDFGDPRFVDLSIFPPNTEVKREAAKTKK